MTSSLVESQLVDPDRAQGFIPARLDYDLRGAKLVRNMRGDARILDPSLAGIVEQAALDAAAAARAEGFALGYIEGREQIELELHAQHDIDRRTEQNELARAVASLGAATTALASAASALESLSATEYETTGTELGGVVYALVEELLGRELQADRVHVLDAVSRAAQQIPHGSALRIRLHPEDSATLAEQGIDLAARLGREVTVISDSTIERGGALADSGCRHVDARLSVALERLKAAIGA